MEKPETVLNQVREHHGTILSSRDDLKTGARRSRQRCSS
jgi:hypothetical protein